MQLPSWPGALPLGTPGSCLWTDAGCPARAAAEGDRANTPSRRPARAAPAAFPDPRVGQMQVRLRGGRQRAAVPSALPARGSAPGNPDSMPSMPNAWRTCLRAEWSRLLLIQVLA